MKKIKYVIIVLLLLLGVTGCTTYLKSNEGKAVVNPTTGQSLPENILCRPTDEETIKIYEENNYDLSSLPACVCKDNKECEEYKINSGKYEGLWSAIFVKPLAWVILFLGKYTGSFGLGLIITSILIRLIVFPLTKKSTMQAAQMQKIQPELNKLEKKYEKKDQNDREVMMMKSQEMMAIYKKYHINPVSGCLPALLQLPLFIAFLDAVNRVPAIFEEKFLMFHLGTTPYIGISNGNWWYILLTILVAVSTYFSFNKATQNQTPSSNTNGIDMTKQTKMMTNGFSIMITVMSVFMSSALNIYWVVSNACTLIQNYLVKRSMK